MKPELTALLVSAGVIIAIFFATRMFWLWYFKLDKIEAHLAAISSALESMAETTAPDVEVKKVADEK